jgi:hypothetical protein
MDDTEAKALLRLKPGEAMRLPRHGESGTLYAHCVRLSEAELCLYSEVYKAWGERDLGTRETVVALVRRTAATSRYITPDTFEAAVDHVMQYLDELACLGAAHGRA